jgi:hypothetical protein
MNRCGHCLNCQTLKRYNTHYEAFLRDYPSKGNEEWINGLKEVDEKNLPCWEVIKPTIEIQPLIVLTPDQEADARSVCYEERN